MRFPKFFSLVLFAFAVDAAAADLYSVVNGLRAGEGVCPAAEKLASLQPQAALEFVARDLARGGNLDSGMQRSGYRAVRSSFFSIRGEGVGARAEGLLSKGNYCRQLQQAALRDVGIYVDARQIWIVLAAPFAPPLGDAADSAGKQVLDLVNEARATPRYCGNRKFNAAQPLRWNDRLAAASRLHAEDMARNNYFSHGGRDGSNPAQRVERAGYRYRATGENIAAGQLNAGDAVAGWIKSPGHCANLMNPRFTEMGAGLAVDRSSELGVYWAQAFGAPR